MHLVHYPPVSPGHFGSSIQDQDLDGHNSVIFGPLNPKCFKNEKQGLYLFDTLSFLGWGLNFLTMFYAERAQEYFNQKPSVFKLQ